MTLGLTYMVILGAVLLAVCAGGALSEWWLRRQDDGPTEWFDDPYQVESIQVNEDGSVEGFALPFPPEHLPDAFTPEERVRYRATLRDDDGPTDDEIYNGPGREGGIVYDQFDEPGSLGENDWRL